MLTNVANCHGMSDGDFGTSHLFGALCMALFYGIRQLCASWAKFATHP